MKILVGWTSLKFFKKNFNSVTCSENVRKYYQKRGEKILAKCMSAEGLVYKIQKELLKLTIRKQTVQFKNG